MKFILHFNNEKVPFFTQSLEMMTRFAEEFFRLAKGQFSMQYKDEDGDPIHLQL
jgi:hypothetical protein